MWDFHTGLPAWVSALIVRREESPPRIANLENAQPDPPTHEATRNLEDDFTIHIRSVVQLELKGCISFSRFRLSARCAADRAVKTNDDASIEASALARRPRCSRFEERAVVIRSTQKLPD